MGRAFRPTQPLLSLQPQEQGQEQEPPAAGQSTKNMSINIYAVFQLPLPTCRLQPLFPYIYPVHWSTPSYESIS